MKLADFVKETMQKESLSQASFAKKCGISQSIVSNIINGQDRFEAETVLRIANSHGLTPQTFLEWPFTTGTCAENPPDYHTKPEQRLLDAFRKLDPGRQKEMIEYAEYKAHQVGPHGIGGRES